MAETKTGKISDLTLDDNNFNRHTEVGKKMLRKSIDKFGYGRSIVADKNGRIIGGNGIVEVSDDADTIVVETTGDKLVVVKRTDIDLDSQQGREMALADNATGFADLAWDTKQLEEVASQMEIDFVEWGVKIDKKTREIEGDVPFTEILGEEHNYVVLYCDNDVDWLQMQSLLDIGRVRELSTKKGADNGNSKKIGIGRIMKWQDAYKKLMGYENIG